MTTYFTVHFVPPDPDQPDVSFHEVDDERWEKRRVEVFEDGRMTWSDTVDPESDLSLSLEPLPPLEEIDSEPEFAVTVIDAATFETAWDRALRSPLR